MVVLRLRQRRGRGQGQGGDGVAMALGWERPCGEAVEGHGQRWLTGVAMQQGRAEQGGRERDGAAAATGGSSRAGGVGGTYSAPARAPGAVDGDPRLPCGEGARGAHPAARTPRGSRWGRWVLALRARNIQRSSGGGGWERLRRVRACLGFRRDGLGRLGKEGASWAFS